MNDIAIQTAMANMPAAMRERMLAGQGVNRNFSEGVRESFPLISIKGKVFRARLPGQPETPLIDPQTHQPIPFLDVIMVNGSPYIAKTYYVNGFNEGDFNPPDCWSLDGVRPDHSVANKVSITCALCPMNAFGSAPRRDNNPNKLGGKACSDYRRVAVVLPHELRMDTPRSFLLRIPQSSLKNMKAHAQHLERYGIDMNATVVRLQFDYQDAYPKLLFNFVRALTEDEYARVCIIAESQNVSAMLTAPDFENAPSTTPKQQDPTSPLTGFAPQAGPIIGAEMGPTPGYVPPVQPAVYQPATQQAPVGVQQAVNIPPAYVPAPVQQAPVQAAPAPVMAPQQDTSGLIQMADGQWLDILTGEVVEIQALAPQVAIDPDTKALPNGKFFNLKLKSFVTGPEVGAPAEGAAPAVVQQPVTAPPKKTRQTKPKEEPKPVAPVQQAQPQQVSAVQPHQPQPVAPVQHVSGANGQAQPGDIAAADAELEKTLMDLLPPVQ